jgi:hypothetical protein
VLADALLATHSGSYREPVGYCAPEQDPPIGAGADSAVGRFTGPYNLTGHPAVSPPVPATGLLVVRQLAATMARTWPRCELHQQWRTC